MRKNTGFQEIDERSRWLIRQKSAQLIGQYGFTVSDAEDIEQELTVHLWLRLASYDPKRGAKSTFVESVLKNKIRSIISGDRQSGRYDYRMVAGSLDEPIGQESDCGLTVGDTIASESRFGLDAGSLTTDEMTDLQIDLRCALAVMSDEMRAVCLGLMRGSIADFVRETGMPRHRVLWLRKRIKRVFFRFGLNQYC